MLFYEQGKRKRGIAASKISVIVCNGFCNGFALYPYYQHLPKKTNSISDWSFLLLIAGFEFVVGATLMLCETQSTLGTYTPTIIKNVATRIDLLHTEQNLSMRDLAKKPAFPNPNSLT